ncbi:MAG: hypothetical protein NC318_09855 [Blautia sp.]|nr:hypothetical protein [Lachnoclostridium sp.]MCM1211895.1 hypothetical protein [Blautia sp.]
MKKESHQFDKFEETIFQMAKQEKMILPETLEKRVNDTLVSLQTPQNRHSVWKMTWKKSIVLAAALIATFSVTVTAAVNIIQQRMEAMNEQEIEAYFSGLYQNQIGIDNYNRPYTDTEKKRLKELDTAYREEARFPEGVLTMLSDPAQYRGKGVAFYAVTATFFLPEKELEDEELLQIIDFRYKRDYSLQLMREKIESGEVSEEDKEKLMKGEEKEIEATDEEILLSDAIWNPAQELTIPYTGSLEIRDMAAGRDCIFLMGWNAIHKMEIGSSDSTLFFDDFEVETDITALYQDKKGDIYIALMERTEEDDTSAIIAGDKYKNALWVLSADGKLKKKIDLSSQIKGWGVIKRLVVDEQGYIYLRVVGSNALLSVLDKDGNYVKDIVADLESPFMPHSMAGLGIGKDGRVYTQVETGTDLDNWHMGIASVDLEGGCLDEVYLDIVPDDTIMLDIIAPGADTDFVFWGYDGIFTYNLGEESALNILPAYEAPGIWGEGSRYCALPDGRLVFLNTTEWRKEYRDEEQTEEYARVYRIPEKTCFYYKSGLRSK